LSSCAISDELRAYGTRSGGGYSPILESENAEPSIEDTLEGTFIGGGYSPMLESEKAEASKEDTLEGTLIGSGY